MRDVYVTESGNTFPTYYQVWVDGKVYDSFPLLSKPKLTWSQMNDVADGYKEALANYTHPCYDSSTENKESLN